MARKRVVRIRMTTTNGRPVTESPGSASARASRSSSSSSPATIVGLSDVKSCNCEVAATFEFDETTNAITSSNGAANSIWESNNQNEDVNFKVTTTKFDAGQTLTLTNFDQGQPLTFAGAPGKIICIVEITPQAPLGPIV